MSGKHRSKLSDEARIVRMMFGPTAPPPRFHEPDAHGRRVRARCVSIRPIYAARYRRYEYHLYSELLDEPFRGTEVWQKLNYYEDARLASHYYKWYAKLCDEFEEGDGMPPTDFEGKVAWITLRGDQDDKVTLVDSKVTPELILEDPDPPPKPTEPSRPSTLAQHPNPSPDTHDQPTQTQHPYPVPNTRTQQQFDEDETAPVAATDTDLNFDAFVPDVERGSGDW